MRWWIYTAGAERVRHLALMRGSVASRSFSRWHLFLLAAGVTLLQLSDATWHRVIRTPDNAGLLAATPAEKGWLRVSTAEMMPRDYGCVAVWLNPTRTAVALLPAAVAGLVVAWAVMWVPSFGARTLVGRRFRGDGRLEAALRYGTAWVVPVWYAALVVVLVPLIEAARASRLPLVPPPAVFQATAAVLAGGAAFMWWFLLVRLGQTMPGPVRARITAYYAVFAVLLIAGVVVIWRVAIDRLFEFLWTLFHLRW